MPFAQSDGARIYWRLDGRPDRPPLVMVSSLGSDHGMWNPVLAGLEREFHVLRLDKRGHGASDVPDGEYSLAQLGRDVLACADAAGWKRFHYAGLSIGGMIGNNVARNRAEAEARVAQLDHAGALERLKAAQALPAAERGADPFELAIVDARRRDVEALLRESARED